MTKTLIIVPCGQRKVWDKNPNLASVKAEEVYTGAPFKVNAQYAKRFADKWVILSANIDLLLLNL